MAWFQKQEKAPRPVAAEVPRAPSRMEGLWSKCEACEEIVYRQDLEANLNVCPHCQFHMALSGKARLLSVLDRDSFEELDGDLGPLDPLGFSDSKRYRDRTRTLRKSLGVPDAFAAGLGRLDGHPVAAGAFEFEFMGGSMGSVVGEKVTRLIERAIEREAALVIFSASGGARMQEGIYSLMQMAKTSAALARFHKGRRPYVSVLCHPTTGGVAASFAWLGDVILAEPHALIGFAGPRVIEQTIRQKLPEGFQRSEFLLDHGMIDAIVPRGQLREKLAQLLGLLAPEPRPMRREARAAHGPPDPMNRDEALAWLDGLGAGRIELGLDRIRAVLERLRGPDRAYPSLHVAGTNGKGSTCAMAAAALRSAGLRVGLYTSPHLVSFEERIAIDGVPIGAAALAEGLNVVREAAAGIPLTYFEAGTALALHAFREARVDVAVLETGLGGRLDATTAVRPVACAITALGLDHVELLGPTLAHVASEKAGILEAGVPCAVAASAPEAMEVVERRAREQGSPLLVEGRDFALEGSVYRGPAWTLPNVLPALRGPHQRQNAAVAIALLELASTRLPVGPEAAGAGVRSAVWPGRLELFSRDGVTVALDGAHNPQGAAALAASLTALWPGRRPTLVFGVLADKDVARMMAELFPAAARALLVAPRSPRAREPDSLLPLARAHCPDVRTAPSVAEALEAAIREPGPDRLVVVCGSLYLIGEARAKLLG